MVFPYKRCASLDNIRNDEFSYCLGEFKNHAKF